MNDFELLHFMLTRIKAPFKVSIHDNEVHLIILLDYDQMMFIFDSTGKLMQVK